MCLFRSPQKSWKQNKIKPTTAGDRCFWLSASWLWTLISHLAFRVCKQNPRKQENVNSFHYPPIISSWEPAVLCCLLLMWEQRSFGAWGLINKRSLLGTAVEYCQIFTVLQNQIVRLIYSSNFWFSLPFHPSLTHLDTLRNHSLLAHFPRLNNGLVSTSVALSHLMWQKCLCSLL